jgi:pre-rRNA-processing protein TSR3
LFVFFVSGIPNYVDNDPEKCTSVRSVVEGNFKKLKKIPRKCVVLDFAADEYLSKKDLRYAKNGICVIDGPWYIMPDLSLKLGKNIIKRKLPVVLATNPHYPNTTMISCVEAMALALKILGFNEQAKEILKPFPWAKDFLRQKLSKR